MSQNKKAPKRGKGRPYWETRRGKPVLQKHHVTPQLSRRQEGAHPYWTPFTPPLGMAPALWKFETA